MLATPNLDPWPQCWRAGVRGTQLWSSRQGQELHQHLQFVPPLTGFSACPHTASCPSPYHLVTHLLKLFPAVGQEPCTVPGTEQACAILIWEREPIMAKSHLRLEP